ncbi:MAG: hypothetical protein FWC36_01730 [Spirochaetes bacterium]|nr:hypothetical protein [Spirochaetota bacterium]
MRIALIYDNRVQNIFEKEKIPVYPPSQNGIEIILLDITNRPEIVDGDIYDPVTGELFHIPEQPNPISFIGDPPEERNYFITYKWNELKKEWFLDYEPVFSAELERVRKRIAQSDWIAAKAIKLGWPHEKLVKEYGEELRMYEIYVTRYNKIKLDLEKFIKEHTDIYKGIN